jgi:FtsP/CotA-like multicopper oxidase with cupredoxin domain
MHDQTEHTPETTSEITPHSDADAGAEPTKVLDRSALARRTFLRVGAVGVTGAAAVAVRDLWVPSLAQRGMLSADGAFAATSTALGDTVFFLEVFPTSPLILNPFTDPLNVPKALLPIDPTSLNPAPGPGLGQQSSRGNTTHQKWSSDVGYQDPIVYKIDLLVRTHDFTTQQVLPINSKGQPTVSFDATGKQYAKGVKRTLPSSTIYGFNGTFPGPMINAEYGKPSLVRFTNRLDENPMNLQRQDFGAPDYSFLTHLHNGHTAPESDGNPHWAFLHGPQSTSGWKPKDWVDQLYLNWPAGATTTPDHGESEKQSFFWFHDHRMDHTGANVYKGLVGLYPIYDPVNDTGDETKGYGLPGVRTDHDGTFDVDYDIPLAFYDCRLDDGVTIHHDFHDAEYPEAGNPRTHPEWWGMTYFRHFPNHGFVGDIFTVNGTAYPVLEVEARKYRFRLLDASVSRIYDFKLMTSTNGPKAAKDLGFVQDDLDGQYRIPDGQQCMQFYEIATDGGLLPAPIVRDNFELWPAKRREVVIDFSQYMDGSTTTPGKDIVYLTNVMKMSTGRMWDNSTRFAPDPAYKVPVLAFKIVKPTRPDNSVIPTAMRPLPPLPSNWKNMLNNRLIFEVKRGQLGGEIEWLINGVPFDPTRDLASLKNPAGKSPLAQQKIGSFNLWEIRNGGGGWVHPFHLHMEEHRTVMRNGRDVSVTPDAGHPDDLSREDLAALDPSESVIIYRGFRDFVGEYVAHCHNLAHEDHAMMFGWSIVQ